MGFGSVIYSLGPVLSVACSLLVACGGDEKTAPSGEVSAGQAGSSTSAGTGGASTGGSGGMQPSSGGTLSAGGTAAGGSSRGGSSAGGSSAGGSTAQGGAQQATGKVTVVSTYWTRGSELGGSSIAARFSNSVLDGECTRETFGACFLETCPDPDPNETAPHAGAILVTTKSRGTEPFQQLLSPTSGTGAYEPWTTRGTTFFPEDMLDVFASGGDVPTFREVVPFPHELTLVAPALTDDAASSGMIRVPTTQDFQLSWDGVTAEDVIVVVQTNVKVQPTLVCHVPSADKAFSVPKAALAKVPPGTMGEFYVVREKSLTVGRFDVMLRFATILVDQSRSRRVGFQL